MRNLARTLGGMMGEFNTRYAGKHYGRHRAFVVDVSDPDMLGRIKVKIPSLMGDTVTGWCWPASGGSNDAEAPAGLFVLPSKNDMVWVEFENGDAKNPPVWTPGPWSSGSLPDHARALPDESDEGVKGLGATIPPSSFNPTEGYGKVFGWQFPSGSRIEFDETSGESRIQLYHHSGSQIEILSDGTFNLGSAAGLRVQVSGGDLKEYVAQSVQKEIEGLFSQVVKGPMRDEVQGDRVEITGSRSIKSCAGVEENISGDETRALSGSVNTAVGANHRLTIGGQAVMFCQNDIQFQAGGRTSLVGQNSVATGGLPTQTAASVEGYNGHTKVISRDATGVVGRAELDVDGTLLSAVLGVYAAEVDQASLQLSSPGLAVLHALATVQLGGITAVSPVWRGNQALALWTSLLTWLDTHIHTSAAAGSPTTPPVVLSTPTLESLVAACPSTKVLTE